MSQRYTWRRRGAICSIGARTSGGCWVKITNHQSWGSQFVHLLTGSCALCPVIWDSRLFVPCKSNCVNTWPSMALVHISMRLPLTGGNLVTMTKARWAIITDGAHLQSHNDGAHKYTRRDAISRGACTSISLNLAYKYSVFLSYSYRACALRHSGCYWLSLRLTMWHFYAFLKRSSTKMSLLSNHTKHSRQLKLDVIAQTRTQINTAQQQQVQT